MEEFIKDVFTSLGVGVNGMVTSSGMIVNNITRICKGFDVAIESESENMALLSFSKNREHLFNAKYTFENRGYYKTIVDLKIIVVLD